MTKINFVTEPSVNVIAQTQINLPALSSWAAEFEEAAADTRGSPLDKMFGQVIPASREIREEAGDPVYDIASLLSEFGGRFCYRSWTKGRETPDYIKNIIESRHGSVLEHASWTFAIAGVSRSLSLELARHRTGIGFSQESQRYVDAKDIRFVVHPNELPIFKEDPDYRNWLEHVYSEAMYAYEAKQKTLQEFYEARGLKGFKLQKRVNEAARSVLPNAAETRITWTVNARALRHILEVRGSLHAEPEIRNWALKIYEKVKESLIFSDFRVMVDDEAGEFLICDFSKV